MSVEGRVHRARYFKRAVSFIVRKETKRMPRVTVRQIDIPVGASSFRADVYEPAGGVRVRKPVVFIHGMSAFGARDARIVEFCTAATELGHALVVPQIDAIASFSTDLAIVDDLEGLMLAVAADRRLTEPGAKVGLLSVSFTSLYAFMAACRVSLRHRLSSLCFVGGTFSYESMGALLRAQDRRMFPRDVFLLNFLRLSLGARPEIENALMTALLDNSLARTDPELPRCLAALSEEDRTFFERLRQDPAFREPYVARIIEHLAAGLPPRLEGRRSLRASVVLIHGAGDPVLPASDSVELHRDLTRHGVRSHLDVTPLIAHGEALKMHPRLAGPAVRIADSFARFFADVARG